MKKKKNEKFPAGIEMPCERFMKYGASSLSDTELIAIILRSGTHTSPVMQMAAAVLEAGDHANHSLLALYHLTLQDLVKIDGIGEAKGVKLLCILELSKRISMQKCRPQVIYNSPATVAKCYMESMRHLDNEEVCLVNLDNKLGFICDEVLSMGTVNASLISPRNVFTAALRHGAVNIMLLHNHPSGDPTPSREDIEITNKIRNAGDELGIHLIDHLVIGDRQYISMKEQGYL
ncbi:DNA repair protein RadC [Lachnospiraceae bacterium NK3A20]|nr:DNA repair protein RadC [Lachnospiraceae bacterium NK3A20]